MLGFILISLLLHPAHETVAEVEWNSKTCRLEVALRLDALDEQWLSQRVAQKQLGGVDWKIAYLKSRFRIAPLPEEDKPDTTKYRWIGREEERGHVWWYFEIEPDSHHPPSWIQQSVLFEKDEDHTNRVVVLGGVPKRTIVLTMQRSKASLNPADNDEPDAAPKTGR